MTPVTPRQTARDLGLPLAFPSRKQRKGTNAAPSWDKVLDWAVDARTGSGRATVTERRESSGTSRDGEALGVPDETRHGAHYAIKLHRRNREDLCAECRSFQRAYDREYGRLRRQIPAMRQQMAANHRRWYDRAVRSDPARAASINARRRQIHREEQERARLDRRCGIDEVVVLRAIAGDPSDPNRAERLEAVRRLRNQGLPYKEIAARLQVTERQVHRDLTDLGLTGQGAVA